MTGLQQHPPPIDYPNRRAAGDNLGLLTAAANAGRRRHPSAIPIETLVQQFWERLTGGDIAYAPSGIRIGPGTPAYRTFRALLGLKTPEPPCRCTAGGSSVGHRVWSDRAGVRSREPDSVSGAIRPELL